MTTSQQTAIEDAVRITTELLHAVSQAGTAADRTDQRAHVVEIARDTERAAHAIEGLAMLANCLLAYASNNGDVTAKLEILQPIAAQLIATAKGNE